MLIVAWRLNFVHFQNPRFFYCLFKLKYTFINSSIVTVHIIYITGLQYSHSVGKTAQAMFHTGFLSEAMVSLRPAHAC